MTVARPSATNRSEHGQTILLVAASIVAFFAVAALAVDLVTLYSAHVEAQRTADAAALAGAKAFVHTGLTVNALDPNLQSIAQDMATKQATAVVAQNNIAGQPGQLAPPAFNWGTPTTNGNPQITVTVQRTGLATFFARVLGTSLSSVSATATAEAYNPSYSSSNSSGFVPVMAKCIKPFVVPNLDPNHPAGGGGDPFIDSASGAITHPGLASSGGVIGEFITFVSDCDPTIWPSCSVKHHPPGLVTPPVPPELEYLPASNEPITPSLCSSCGLESSTTLEQNIACCNTNVLACSKASATVGGASNPWQIDLSQSPNNDPSGNPGPTRRGLTCAIHQLGKLGQDSLDTSFSPFQIDAGRNNPLVIAGVVDFNDVITTSNSIITIPIYDGADVPPTSNINVIGFMQVFVARADPGTLGDFDGYVLNISGCGSNSPAGLPVSGGGVSSVPVRLVTATATGGSS